MNSCDVLVDAAGELLEGVLTLPPDAGALVLFAHGSGSSRFSPRNKRVAEQLNDAGFGTLLFDLLSADEHRADQMTREYRFDIPLLAGRLSAALDWAAAEATTAGLRYGLFGSSTGAAAALIAAAERLQLARAVVSRGGRPDLAGDALPHVRAPTLLVVGDRDTEVIQLNREAAERMNNKPKLELVPGATHLFEEPGTLDLVVQRAIDWFRRYLVQARRP
ncbi:dienelactone hydrolase family protein [Microbulbifer litoralis]|uniref:dienelactone hydrolase family protein n=1 Tax=Microbulbifer litoralis TaxID=2933965 RepID=UPI00202819A2|nr:alpha/beta family hydrolase [Microbulbifer sp. GX H0434]